MSRSWVFLVVLAGFLSLQGCGGGSSTPNEPTTPTTPTTPPPPPPPPPAPQALANPIPAAIGFGDLEAKAAPFVRVSESNDSSRPGGTDTAYAMIRYMKQADGMPERFFINDARGVLWIYESDWEEPQVYLDLREQSVGFTNATYPNESGLLGFAFHPQFAEIDAAGYGKL